MTFLLEIKGDDGKTRNFRIYDNAQLGRRHDGVELVLRTGDIEEDLEVLDQNVSREHLDMELVSGGEGLKITDVSSRGTKLNDTRMKKGEDGSQVIFSSAEISLAGTTTLYIKKISEIKTIPGDEVTEVHPTESVMPATEKKKSKTSFLAISILSMLIAMAMFFYPPHEAPLPQLPWQKNLTSDITDDVSILLKSDKPYAVVGEDFAVILSAANYPQNPDVILQLILSPPSGMVVSSAELVRQGVGQYTGTYTIPSGGSKAIAVNVEPDIPGNYTIKGTVAYHFVNQEEGKVHDLKIPVFVREKPPEKEERPNYFIPLLVLVSLISGGYYFKTTKPMRKYEAEFEIKSKEIVDEGEMFTLTLKVHNLMGNPKMVLQVIAKSTSEVEVLSKASQKKKIGSGKSVGIKFDLRAEKPGDARITLRLGYNIGGYKAKEKRIHRVRIREKF